MGSCRVSARPRWLKKRLVLGEAFDNTRKILSECAVNTVCGSSLCPNMNECFSASRATFLILGKRCTRSCLFCSVIKGAPGDVDPGECGRVAQAVKRLNLKYACLSSVTRDDLEDGGAGQFAKTVEAVRKLADGVIVEVLVPDFNGALEAIKKVLFSGPDIFSHNIETVKRLYSSVRSGADYDRSIDVLKLAKSLAPGTVTKSGLMLGLGETEKEIFETLRDLRSAGCDMVTIGQYLRPSAENISVAKFYEPGEFDRYRDKALAMGFKSVSSAPFVRSSYFAEECYSVVSGKL